MFDEDFKVDISTHHRKSDEHQVVVDICERIVSIDVPEINDEMLIAGQVDQLERAIQTELARSLAKVTALQEKKASLLAIENKG